MGRSVAPSEGGRGGSFASVSSKMLHDDGETEPRLGASHMRRERWSSVWQVFHIFFFFQLVLNMPASGSRDKRREGVVGKEGGWEGRQERKKDAIQ